MSAGKNALEIIWNEHYQNWPGRLAWVEARIAEGRIPDGYQVTMDALKAERERLVAARNEWERGEAIRQAGEATLEGLAERTRRDLRSGRFEADGGLR